MFHKRCCLALGLVTVLAQTQVCVQVVWARGLALDAVAVHLRVRVAPTAKAGLRERTGKGRFDGVEISFFFLTKNHIIV